MFGMYSRTVKTNQDLRKNRTNMFQGNEAYSGTFSKRNDQPEKELSPREKQEIQDWTNEYNRHRRIRIIGFFAVMAILTAVLVYAIFELGILDSWLIKL